MTNDFDRLFARTREEGRAALIPYLTAGFPDREGYVNLAVAVLQAGGDALEIGIPFSDPLLDGPSIQRSQQLAIENGTTPRDCLTYAAGIRERSSKPLLLFGAYNPMLAYGLDRFVEEAAEAGVSAFIVPDLPFEEQGELRDLAASNGMYLIQLAAPTTGDERLQQLCADASGFIYCMSVAGITGVRAGVAKAARPLVERVRRYSEIPPVVGFGISGPEAAREVGQFADGVAVGTALIDVVARAAPGEPVGDASRFISGLAEALAVPECGTS